MFFWSFFILPCFWWISILPCFLWISEYVLVSSVLLTHFVLFHSSKYVLLITVQVYWCLANASWKTNKRKWHCFWKETFKGIPAGVRFLYWDYGVHTFWLEICFVWFLLLFLLFCCVLHIFSFLHQPIDSKNIVN